MSIFIVSNRGILDVDGEPRFEETPGRGQKASHDFRIAEYDSANTTYRIVGDLDEYGYQGTAAAASAELNGSAYMFNKLYQDNCGDQAGDILVFIHGFAYELEDNFAHINRLEKLYMSGSSRVRHLVYISWPSRGRLLRYKSDQPDARETGRVLGRLFEKLRRFFIDTFEVGEGNEPCMQKIHLGAHSMGNQVLYYMLNSMDPSQLFPLFSEVMLFNSDAPYDGFEPGQPFTRLEDIGERTHIYTHRSDDALWISDNLKGNSKRLGRNGPKNAENLNDETFVVDTSRVKGEPDTSFRETLVDHWGYMNLEGVIKDVRRVLKGRPAEQIGGRSPGRKRNHFDLK